MNRGLIFAGISLYVLLMAVYWFCGSPDVVWAFLFYGLEKLFTAFAFYLVYLLARNRFIRSAALYCLSLCFFMLGYYVYSFLFGDDVLLVVGSFLIFSFVILAIINND